jgi:hypothetical protein
MAIFSRLIENADGSEKGRRKNIRLNYKINIIWQKTKTLTKNLFDGERFSNFKKMSVL